MRESIAQAWRRWRIWRYRDRELAEQRVDRDAAEHIDRLEQGIDDTPHFGGVANGQ
jgi:hypothetical protein